MIKLYADGKLTPAQSVYFTVPRPAEELYDCTADRHELQNLVDDPKFKDVRAKLSAALDEWVRDTRDYIPTLRTADEFDRSKGLPTAARVRPRLSKAEMVKKGLAAP